MKNVKFYLFFLIVTVLCGCSKSDTDSPAGSSFDLVCSAFEQLEADANAESMSKAGRNEFITKKIIQLTPNSDAATSWAAVSSAQAEQRYEIFKFGAEQVTGEEWHCDSMKRLAGGLAQASGISLYRAEANAYCKAHSASYWIDSGRLDELNALSPTAKAQALIEGFRLSVTTAEMQKIIFEAGGTLAAKEFYPHLQREIPKLTKEPFNCPEIPAFYLAK